MSYHIHIPDQCVLVWKSPNGEIRWNFNKGQIGPEPQWFTVMLLRPDYATDNYGQDTFTESVLVANAEEAVAEVKWACVKTDERTQDCNYEEQDFMQYYNDLHVLAVMKGKVEFV